jgi:hypothetical protein
MLTTGRYNPYQKHPIIMTTIIVPIYGFLSSRIKRVLSLSKIAKERKLSISNLEEVGTGVMAIDTTKRKLLYLKNAPGTSSCMIIDLKNLRECTIKKQYDGIKAGDLNKRKMSDFLKNIFLNLRFKNDSASVSLPLYQAQHDKQDDVGQLEEKAKKLETMVSRLLLAKLFERA